MKKLFYTVLVVAVAFFGLTFISKNHETIGINYYFGIDFRIELALLLFVTFALGLLAGYLVALPGALNARRKLSAAKRQLRALQSANLLSGRTGDHPPAG